MNDVIPLSSDTTAADMAGEPKPLTPDGDLTIQGLPGNPDATVKLDADMVDVGGVEVAKELEAEFDAPPSQVPIPAKDGSESE